MLVELVVVEQRYRAVLEVLEGAPVTEVALRFGVVRQPVLGWLRRHAADGGTVNLADRSSWASDRLRRLGWPSRSASRSERLRG